MPSSRHILGQLISGTLPTTGAWHLLYQCDKLDAVISNLYICNQSVGGASYNVAITPVGISTPTIIHYLHFGTVLAASSSASILKGVTLGVGESVYVAANIATMSFSLFGQENWT